MPMLRTRLSLAAALLAAALAAAPSAAQTTYRWIDKSGKTVYSDQAPPADARQVVARGAPETADTPLPYATRIAAERYPVALYTATSCVETCTMARALLNGRGIPFAEKPVNTAEENEALAKRLGSEPGIPTLFVGTQSFKGFEAGEWNGMLDLAGYPQSAPYGVRPAAATTP